MSFIEHYKSERRQDWRTPKPLFDELHAQYRFTLDGAATRADTLLPRYSSKRKPLPWDDERVFCNPPWSDIAPFLLKAPRAKLALFLVPARINTKWAQTAYRLGARIAIPPRRVAYEFPGKKGGAPFDTMALLFGEAEPPPYRRMDDLSARGGT